MTASHTERDRLAEMAVQVRAVARALRQPHAPSFMILLLTYRINGEKYSTTGLTISASATPNFAVTPAGFECDAFFPSELLTQQSMDSGTVENGSVRVRLAVRLKDIIKVVPLTPGR